MKRKLILLLFLIICFALYGCNTEEQLKIEGSTLLELGFNEEYVVKLGNDELSADQFYWTVSDRNVLLNDKNQVTPLNAGICDITAVKKDDGSKVAKITVNVVDAKVKGIEITGKTIVYVDDFINLNAKTDPIDTEFPVIWSCDNESVAIVDETGCVMGIKKGEAKITATCGKAIAEVLVNVKEEVTEVVSYMPEKIAVGQAIEMKFNIDDPVVTIKNDDNNEFSEIIGNSLYAKKEGTIKINVKSKAKPSLAKNFELEVVETQINTVNYEDENIRKINEISRNMKLSQKLAQYGMLSVSYSKLMLNKDEAYYISNSGPSSQVYLSEILGGIEFGNFNISQISNGNDGEDNLKDLNILKQFVKKNSGVDGFEMVSYSVASTNNKFTPQINNKGLSNLSHNDFYKYFENYGKQLKEMGVNVYYTYGYDNTSTNAFSNDPVINNYYTNIMKDALASQGIMCAFTLPYYGEYYDFILDENNGVVDPISEPPVPDYTYIKDILIQMVNNDADMISIVENISNFDGDKTLVQYLRETLKYNGIIYLAYDIYDISSYLSSYDIDTLTNIFVDWINQGISFIDIPVSINSNSYMPSVINQMVEIINKMTEEFNNGKIEEEVINKNIERILSKKLKYNMIDNKTIQSNYSDFTEYFNYVDTTYIKSYYTSTNYSPIDSSKKTIVFADSYTTGNYRTGRKTFDFGASLSKKLGKDNVTVYSKLNRDYQTIFNQLTSTDQIVIYIRNSDYYQFSYKEDGKTKYGGFSWSEVINDLYNKGITNICIIFEDNYGLNDSFPGIKNIICMNGSVQDTYNALTTLLIKGK